MWCCREENRKCMKLQHHVAMMRCHLPHQSDGDECAPKVMGIRVTNRVIRLVALRQNMSTSAKLPNLGWHHAIIDCAPPCHHRILHAIGAICECTHGMIV